jgi:hypothetical protein
MPACCRTLAIGTVWVGYVTATKYLTPSAMFVWGVLVLSMILLAVILLAEGREMIDALWSRTMRRGFRPLKVEGERHWPKVSIHVPIYNEPPQMVMQTIDSLLRLDYPALEIIVVDNNTKDEDVWRPVEAYCADKTDRVKFLHIPHCPGFKAQALNIALANTAPDAEIVGVVDSDYLVPGRLAEEPGALLRQRQGRLRAGAAGPSRRPCQPLQAHDQLGVRRLLQHRHGPSATRTMRSSSTAP